jgi:hypothetical protein
METSLRRVQRYTEDSVKNGRPIRANEHESTEEVEAQVHSKKHRPSSSSSSSSSTSSSSSSRPNYCSTVNIPQAPEDDFNDENESQHTEFHMAKGVACATRPRRPLNASNGIDTFNVSARHPVRGSQEADPEDSAMAKSYRNLKSASLFGKDWVPAGQEAEKGTEIALRATLTGFADVTHSSLAFKGMHETDVKTVLSRFPALEGRELAKQKHELHFEEFAHCFKSKDACTRELAGGLHALLAGQEILRVSLYHF